MKDESKYLLSEEEVDRLYIDDNHITLNSLLLDIEEIIKTLSELDPVWQQRGWSHWSYDGRILYEDEISNILQLAHACQDKVKKEMTKDIGDQLKIYTE